MQFDDHGRCDPSGLCQPANAVTRRYFIAHQPAIDYPAIHQRTQAAFGQDPGISAADFEARATARLEALAADAATANLVKGVHVPFLLPQDSDLADMGAVLEDRYLPAVGRAFADVYPDYDFANQCADPLTGKIEVTPGSRHEQLVDQVGKGPVVGLLFPCLTEYSIPAALEQTGTLPDVFLLAGGIDLAAAFIAAPGLLRRDEGYPPTLWTAALKGDGETASYHFEAYGYNLNFYRRAHLGQVAEYWWSSLTVLA